MVYVDAEAVPQIQNERAAGWGMDRSRLYLMQPEERYGWIDFCGEEDQYRLLQMLYELQPHLVVVDSLSSITLKGENNVEDVRAVLSFLAAAAREFDLALLLIHHLRKRGKALPMMDLVTADDFRGSSHIIAMARSVLALSVVQTGPEPDRNGPRRLEVVKTNLCRYPEAVGVVVEEGGGEGDHACPVGQVGPPVQSAVPRVRYVGAPAGYREPTQAEECGAWLVELLEEAGEALSPKEVVGLAKEAGFSRGVVYRARKELEGVVVDTEGKFSPQNRWAVAETESRAGGRSGQVQRT